MNITIITCVLPWRLNSGGAQAQFNMIDLLRKKHHITIIFPIMIFCGIQIMRKCIIFTHFKIQLIIYSTKTI